MARRHSRDESGLELLFDIAALLPWQVGAILALLAFSVLHWYAGTEPPVLDMKNPADSLTFMFGNVSRQVAGFLQYLLPVVLLLGSSVSFFRRWRQKDIHARVAADPTSSEVSKLNWAEFEGLVVEAFRRKGCRVVERGGAGPDGEVDLEPYLGKDKYLVQCKHWRTYQVGVAIVRELYGVMAAEGAVGGFVVASGEFTADTEAFAEGRSIKLVDSRTLKKLVGAPSPTPVTSAPAQTTPACPVCGGSMVKRPSKRGANAGGEFWGAPSTPNVAALVSDRESSPEFASDGPRRSPTERGFLIFLRRPPKRG
ncbi:restriction endonuclease [Hydrogenophaga taeniospiralis]|uniref:restriction endonuclease n=1 Tax=Hydrogenophaga taeniospiralis TaxID=65656 RepID=UPI001CFB0193|nr:restriction endonuclease [Hydrogenophaga taeniospiralis]